jgi:phosphoribosylanthranilate isomerase
VKVKICGMTRREDIIAAVNAGADAVGFIVDIASSPRNLTVDKARQLIDFVPPFVSPVVVTQSGALESVNNHLHPPYVQIIGADPEAEVLSRLHNVKKIKALQVTSSIVTELKMGHYSMYDALLVDSHIKGQLGGTGRIHDWNVSREIRQLVSPRPLILAGGLTEFNVTEAIKKVRPFAVDVSSGVESRPGVKDHSKMRWFVEAAKKAV